jgi:inner membrane protein
MENYPPKEVHWANSLTFKMTVIAGMVLLLLIPLGMIKSLIRERELSAQDVERDISSQWGSSQILVGPILNIPVEHKIVNNKGEVSIERTWLHVMPFNMKIESQLEPEIRYRGIYKTSVYNSISNIEGSFIPSFNPDEIRGKFIWEQAFVTFSVSDNRGIRGEVDFVWNDQKLPIESGVATKNIASTGFTIKTPLTENCINQTFLFSMKMDLSGSGSFSAVPLAQNSDITISSSWKDPSFSGTLLPMHRTVTAEGFTANWKLTHLNRNFPQYWQGMQFDVWEHKLGVDLFLPVGHYQKSYRSVRYGILFIALTVLVFLFIELTKNKRVHLLQYLLVGMALVLFFSVLTALSEHTGFNVAYLIASAMNIIFIGSFAQGLLKELKLTVWVVGLLLVMYGFLFVLLQLNDYAFLAGNIGLVVVLAVIMKASLKLAETKKN